MAALLASEASRAVLASEVTPPSICAWSGGTDTVASPVTEIIGGGAVSANAGVASDVAAATASARKCFMRLISAAHRR